MMKFGLNTAILEHMNFEEVVAFTSEIGFESLEVACWPQGEAERRYAGVSHLDVTQTSQKYWDDVNALCKKHHLEISALAFYPNTMDEDLKAREVAIIHLYKVIDASVMLGVNMVTTFVGRIPSMNADDSFKLFEEVWTPIIKYAEDKDVKIAIENCPMWFSNDEWPGGKNLFTSPANWKRAFELIDSDHFGINYDPSHFVWQQIDYIKPLYEFKDKIFHVHFKDIKLYKEKLERVGVMANPLEYMAPKLPGLGDVNWAQYISALNDIGFKGHAVIEVEDKSYEDTHASIEKSIMLSYRYLRQYVI